MKSTRRRIATFVVSLVNEQVLVASGRPDVLLFGFDGGLFPRAILKTRRLRVGCGCKTRGCETSDGIYTLMQTIAQKL
ncbi:MAG: hypothetical protein WCA97_07875 [Terriglobales bacterium]